MFDSYRLGRAINAFAGINLSIHSKILLSSLVVILMMGVINGALVVRVARYNRQCDAIITNIIAANELNGTFDPAIDSVMWEIVAGKTAFEEGSQYTLLDGATAQINTHFLDQVYEVADRITVLPNGKLVGTHDAATLSRLDLVSQMIDRSLEELDDVGKKKQSVGPGTGSAAVIEADGLGRIGSVNPFNLELYPGEVVGLAGLLGSGRTETANLLFGVDNPDSSSLAVDGKKVARFSPPAAIAYGIGFCPENRKSDGIVDDLTVRENIVLALQASRGWFKSLNKKKQYEIADNYIKLLTSPRRAQTSWSGISAAATSRK